MLKSASRGGLCSGGSPLGGSALGVSALGCLLLGGVCSRGVSCLLSEGSAPGRVCLIWGGVYPGVH